MIFKDRLQAGQVLGEKIANDNPGLVGNPRVVVLGIPRGGVVVASEISKQLSVPLDVVIVRKLGVPYSPEFAFGAVDLDGRAVINESTVLQLGLTSNQIEEVKEKELSEARRREEKFRRGRWRLNLRGRTVILVDDGIATGATAEAATDYVLSRNPSKVILAAPVMAADTAASLKSKFKNQNAKFSLVYLEAPKDFAAVGQFYEGFPQVTDEEVVGILSSKLNPSG